MVHRHGQHKNIDFIPYARSNSTIFTKSDQIPALVKDALKSALKAKLKAFWPNILLLSKAGI